MTNESTPRPTTWAERQALYGKADLTKKAEVDYSRPRPAPRERRTSVRHRSIR